MTITVNTYGIRSINSASFNASGACDANGYLIENIPIAMRDLVNTVLRINNLTLNILGYIPGIQQISGCVHMGIGGSILLLTLAVGSRSAENGVIVGRWYDEALLTGIAQVTRGALEALVPFGSLINMSLDGVGTICNIGTELSNLTCYCGDEPPPESMHRQHPPYSDPSYPALLSFLYLA